MTKKILESLKSPIMTDDDLCTPSPKERNLGNKLSPMTRADFLNGHSTPKRAGSKSYTDYSEAMYVDSPIEPLTQHPPNEVGWNFHSDNVQNPGKFELSRTPKRANYMTKRKNSNSPLLHKPFKKKLIANDNEGMQALAADLQSLIERNSLLPKSDIKSESVVESQNNNTDTKLQDSASENSQIKIANNIKLEFSSFSDDLMDHCMVQCTQEIENREFGTQKNKSGNSSDGSSKVSDNSMEKMVTHLSNINVQSLNNNNLQATNVDSGSQNLKSGNSNSLEFPDDSFDDIFKDLDENELCNKNCQKDSSKSKTNFKTENQKFPKLQNQVNVVSTSQPKAPTIVHQAMPNPKASFGYLSTGYNKKYANQKTVNPTASTNSNNDTRTFKSKSVSESNFFQNSQTHSNSQTFNSRYVGNSQQSIVASNTSSNQKSKPGLSKHHSESSFDAKKSNGLSSSNSFGMTKQCTQEEIDRKRREALMKRQEKLKQRSVQSNLNKPQARVLKR